MTHSVGNTSANTSAKPSAAAASAETPEFPMARAPGCPFDPPPALRALQADAPISRVRLWDGSTAWLVTRYDDQRALLADPRLSSDTRHPGYPHPSDGTRERRKLARTFITMDD